MMVILELTQTIARRLGSPIQLSSLTLERCKWDDLDRAWTRLREPSNCLWPINLQVSMLSVINVIIGRSLKLRSKSFLWRAAIGKWKIELESGKVRTAAEGGKKPQNVLIENLDLLCLRWGESRFSISHWFSVSSWWRCLYQMCNAVSVARWENVKSHWEISLSDWTRSLFDSCCTTTVVHQLYFPIFSLSPCSWLLERESLKIILLLHWSIKQSDNWTKRIMRMNFLVYVKPQNWTFYFSLSHSLSIRCDISDRDDIRMKSKWTLEFNWKLREEENSRFELLFMRHMCELVIRCHAWSTSHTRENDIENKSSKVEIWFWSLWALCCVFELCELLPTGTDTQHATIETSWERFTCYWFSLYFASLTADFTISPAISSQSYAKAGKSLSLSLRSIKSIYSVEPSSIGDS